MIFNEMKTLQNIGKETAKKFSASDWVGIVEAIFNLFKECRENRASPEQVKLNIRRGGGLFTRIRARRQIKLELGDSMSIREKNQLADYLVDRALDKRNDEELEALVREMNESEDFLTLQAPVHEETATDVPAANDGI